MDVESVSNNQELLALLEKISNLSLAELTLMVDKGKVEWVLHNLGKHLTKQENSIQATSDPSEILISMLVFFSFGRVSVLVEKARKVFTRNIEKYLPNN